jgi:hypothetical protein
MIRALVVAIAATIIVSCAPQPRFEWGAYDQSLYLYSKNPAAKENYVKALEQAIARGKARNALAPGLQAELGYIRLEAGDVSAAVALFEAEAARFPESAAYMRKVIAAATAPPEPANAEPRPSS